MGKGVLCIGKANLQTEERMPDSEIEESLLRKNGGEE
jgi:hypothetical protein